VLLDIEGTTTPIDFVHTTLFGYARARVNAFLQEHWDEPDVRADIAGLETEHYGESSDPAPAPWRDDAAAVTSYVHWLMDRDRKSTGLKSLQGKIWEEGYRSGRLRGEVYPDVPPALERWRRAGVAVAIFSSGSVQAQRSLFRNSTAGDLSRFIQGYFDTTTGPKRVPESYARIAAALGRSPVDVLFVSDVATELDAARKAGMGTALSVRGPDLPSEAGTHPVVRSFDQLP
jgi:enolase-phosphatase E1